MVDAKSIGKLIVLAAAKQGFTLDELKDSLLLDDSEIDMIVDKLKEGGLLKSKNALILTAKGEAAASEAIRVIDDLVSRALERDEKAIRALAPYLAIIPYIIEKDHGFDPSNIIIEYFSSPRRRAS